MVARDERPIPTNDGLSDMTHADHAQIERKLAAIMLADIAGFSALMERDETRTYQCLRALREQICRTHSRRIRRARRQDHRGRFSGRFPQRNGLARLRHHDSASQHFARSDEGRTRAVSSSHRD